MGSGEGGGAARDRARLIVLGAASVLVLVLLASTMGTPIAGTPTRDFEQPTQTLTRPTSTDAATPPTRSLPPQTPPSTPMWTTSVVYVLLLGVAVAVAFMILRWVRVTIRRRRKDAAPPPPPIPPELAAATLLQDTARHWGALDEGDPDEAIVAMWVALERSVARAGVERRPSETSGELTVRVLDRLAVDSDAVATLAALYREARFSKHPMTDERRNDARSALRRVHASLGRRDPLEDRGQA